MPELKSVKKHVVITTYYECQMCKARYYSEDSYGYLKCPVCLRYGKITSKVDVTGGQMKLPRYRGMDYSSREEEEE